MRCNVAGLRFFSCFLIHNTSRQQRTSCRVVGSMVARHVCCFRSCLSQHSGSCAGSQEPPPSPGTVSFSPGTSLCTPVTPDTSIWVAGPHLWASFVYPTPLFLLILTTNSSETLFLTRRLASPPKHAANFSRTNSGTCWWNAARTWTAPFRDR